ncbi:MAG: tyrosine-type recombinase/integrase [Acidimicrobiales bacterium]
MNRAVGNPTLASTGSSRVRAHAGTCCAACTGTTTRGEEPTLERGRLVEEADIPTATAVHALAAAAAAGRAQLWWRELEVLLVAYSGLRWGEHAALTADRVDVARRRIVVDRQVIETRRGLKLGPPKSRRKRTTMFPARTPDGVDLAALVGRRLGELPADGLLFPSPRGQWARRSNYRRNVFDPAATAAGWPRHDNGTLVWTFHSLRHVFATWALAQPGARIEDVSPASSATPPSASPKTSTSPPTPTSTTASTKPPPDAHKSDGVRRSRAAARPVPARVGLSHPLRMVPA